MRVNWRMFRIHTMGFLIFYMYTVEYINKVNVANLPHVSAFVECTSWCGKASSPSLYVCWWEQLLSAQPHECDFSILGRWDPPKDGLIALWPSIRYIYQSLKHTCIHIFMWRIHIFQCVNILVSWTARVRLVHPWADPTAQEWKNRTLVDHERFDV